MRVGRADHRESPPARTRKPLQLRQQVIDLRLVADGIAADERCSRDDPVGEESTARRREEITLVASQCEEREAVAAVAVHERPRHPPLSHRLCDGVAERPQTEVEGEKAEDDGEAEEGVAGAVRQLDAAQLSPAADRGDAREGRAEAEQRPDARRVAGHVEAASPLEQRRE